MNDKIYLWCFLEELDGLLLKVLAHRCHQPTQALDRLVVGERQQPTDAAVHNLDRQHVAVEQLADKADVTWIKYKTFTEEKICFTGRMIKRMLNNDKILMFGEEKGV